MANIQRIRVAISGLGGGPGLATFYAPEADTTAVAALGTFYTAIKNLHPAGVTWDIPGSGDTIDEGTGHVVGVWTQSGSSQVTSTAGVNTHAAGVGCRVRWFTGGIVHFRRVTGSTFLVPLVTAQYEANGTLISTAISTISSAAGTLVTGADLKIWSPPFDGSPTVPARAGTSHTVLGHTVPDKVSWLRTRRT